MTTATAVEVPTLIGTPFAGGIYAGRFVLDGHEYANILALKAAGEHEDTPWNKSLKEVSGALSYIDGLANTQAMAAAGSKIAKWALEQRIGDFDDWHIPALDQLELCYRHLKPTTERNWCYARSGINLHSAPQGHPYTPDSPQQTTVYTFRADGAEAFDPVWYWTSTQYAGYSDFAWLQNFGDGFQGSGRKSNDFRVRLVRRELIR